MLPFHDRTCTSVRRGPTEQSVGFVRNGTLGVPAGFVHVGSTVSKHGTASVSGWSPRSASLLGSAGTPQKVTLTPPRSIA